MKVPEADKAGFDNRIYVIGETKLCIKQYLRTTPVYTTTISKVGSEYIPKPTPCPPSKHIY